MPRFDGTGPAGAGRMTGRGAGPCAKEQAGTSAPRQMENWGVPMGGGRGLRCRAWNPGLRGGCGFGFARGMGRGRGIGYQAAWPMTEEERKTALENQKEHLQNCLNEVDKQLSSF